MPNNKNNNSGWNNNNWNNGNNNWNNGWNNNKNWNNSWSNNNNNSLWSNNNNNNQNNGPVTITYEVPVEVLKAHDSSYSMANNAINHTARVEERNGEYRYTVKFHSMQRDFGGQTLTGNLYNLFIYDNGKFQASQSGNEWSWIMDGKYDRVNIAVWVDVMDAIAGGGEGSGEQKAYLKFDWSKAKELESANENPTEAKENSKSSSEIKILVNNKEIKPETPAYIENGRTMVPIRFISEALGEKVEWKNETRTVIIGGNKESLVIGSKEIQSGQKTITIDSPAVIKDSRTFVPLRAIAEILGAKVDWDNINRAVIINR